MLQYLLTRAQIKWVLIYNTTSHATLQRCIKVDIFYSTALSEMKIFVLKSTTFIFEMFLAQRQQDQQTLGLVTSPNIVLDISGAHKIL